MSHQLYTSHTQRHRVHVDTPPVASAVGSSDHEISRKPMAAALVVLGAASAGAFGASQAALHRNAPVRPLLSAHRTVHPPEMAIALPPAVAGLGLLGSVVFFHELGHFAAARACRIRVDSFNVGFGPPLLEVGGRDDDANAGVRDGERRISYALRALPIGGYVGFPRYVDEESLERRGVPKDMAAKMLREQDVEEDDPDLLENRPFSQQALVVWAGVLANLVLAWNCLFVGAVGAGVPQINVEPVGVVRVLTDSAAEAAGLRKGDLFLKINRVDLPVSADAIGVATKSIGNLVRERTPITLSVVRNGRDVEVRVPQPAEGKGIGVELTQRARVGERRKLPPSEAAARATKGVASGARDVAGSIGPAFASLIRPAAGSTAQLQGPLSITRTGGELARDNPSAILEFLAVLNINLAVFNALPIPGLDGFLFLTFGAEAARGKKIPEVVKEALQGASSLLFLAVFARVLLSDLGASAGAVGTVPGYLLSGAAVGLISARVGAFLLASDDEKAGETARRARDMRTAKGRSSRGRAAPRRAGQAPTKRGWSLRGPRSSPPPPPRQQWFGKLLERDAGRDGRDGRRSDRGRGGRGRGRR